MEKPPRDWKGDHHGGATLRGDLLTLDVTHEHDDYVLRVYDPEQRTVLCKETIPLGKDAQGYRGDLDAAKLAAVELAARYLRNELQSLKRPIDDLPERKRVVEQVLTILRHPLVLMSRPDRETAYELAQRFEITAVDLLDAATKRSKQA